jgi:RHS repeat-associated protein
VILLVLDADDNNAILKRYIHANEQIIMQHDVVDNNKSYFYLHDRLGSVRHIMDSTASVKNCYTYDPWGLPVGDETSETFFNPYRFAGYFWDVEVSQYHCFRRQYDPVLGRFTSRDPVRGKFHKPLTLHKYLYCLNDPVDRTDPTGEYISARRILRPMWEAAWISTTTVLSQWPSTSTVIGPIALMAGTTEAGFNVLHILYIRSLQHIIMNVILYEDLGVSEEDLLPVGWDLLFGRY